MPTAAPTADHAVIWQPQPGPQAALLACPVFDVFFGGARGGGKTDGMLRGALVRYREWYGAAAPNVGLKVPAEAVADRIRALERNDGHIAYGVLDPAAFASDGGPSIAERVARRGVHFRPADNARVAARGALGGWDQLRARLIGEGGRPGIYLFSTCADTIRTLPALQHDAARARRTSTARPRTTRPTRCATPA